MVNDLDTITEIYRDSKRFLSGNDAHPQMFASFFGPDALLLQDGSVHSTERSKLQTAFLPMVLPGYFNLVREASISFWETVQIETHKKGFCRLSDLVGERLLSVIIQVTGGEEGKRREAELKHLFGRMVRGFASFPGTPSYRDARRARELLLKAIREMIEHKLETSQDLLASLPEAGGVTKDMVRRGKIDLITLLCSEIDGKMGELDDVAQKILFIWLAGHTTQASAILCAIGKLDAAIKSRLEDEQVEMQRKYGRNAGWRELRQGSLPVLEAYLNEILRLYPPVTIAFRRTATNTVLAGHTVEAGAIVVLDLWNAGRNEKYFRHARELDADRFLRENGDGRNLGVIAFGAPGGRHYCLGSGLALMTMTCLMSEMLSKWDVGLAPNQDLVVKAYPEVKPRSGCVVVKCQRKVMPLLRRRMQRTCYA